VFATTNPFGVGHNWVKKRFINKAPAGKILREEINVFNPRTGQREIVVKTQTHLFGSYKENKYLSPEYIAELEKITDPNRRKAWLEGSWDIVSGGMFDDVWGHGSPHRPPVCHPELVAHRSLVRLGIVEAVQRRLVGGVRRLGRAVRGRHLAINSARRSVPHRRVVRLDWQGEPGSDHARR
jgi:hypothetical protein